jgi:hypothetical protein
LKCRRLHESDDARRHAGVIIALMAVPAGVYTVIYFSWFPLGADNPPSTFEHSLAHKATNRYLAKNAPKRENPFQPTAENVIEGAQKYEAHCAVCHGGAAIQLSPLENKFSPKIPQLSLIRSGGRFDYAA